MYHDDMISSVDGTTWVLWFAHTFRKSRVELVLVISLGLERLCEQRCVD